ncbi:MAG: phosphotransferase [Solirubrobacteraceae bacterium]
MSASDTSVALVAAQAVARTHGVSCADARVLPWGSNTLVHLKPSPLVARVMTATAVLHRDVEAWLESEVAVGVFVAGHGGPLVPPSDLLAPGPYHHDGLWMTVWTFVEHNPSDRSPDPHEVGHSLRTLHAILSRFGGKLEPFARVRDEIARFITSLSPCSWLTERDIDQLDSELARVTPTVFAPELAGQPIHGDASLSNVLHTSGGVIWNDFEDVCTGPNYVGSGDCYRSVPRRAARSETTRSSRPRR